MKRKIGLSLIFTSLIALSSCGTIFSSEVTLYIHPDNGEPVRELKVKIGFSIKDIETPVRLNSTFDKWYSDINLREEYDRAFIVEEMHLYAAYQLDTVRTRALIDQTAMKAFVTVEAHNTPNYLGANTSIAQGSGVIFHQDEEGYYVLTNNHVTVKPQNGTSYSQALYIYDYDHLIPYTATKIHELNTYDLAIVRFQSVRDYHLIPFSPEPLYANRDVVAIGTPLGVYNQVTYGKTLGYGEVDLEDEAYLSDVNFPVIVHDAEIDHGSSGGPLLNYRLDLVGINFASGTDELANNVSVAIPMDNIYDYFDIVGGRFSDLT